MTLRVALVCAALTLVVPSTLDAETAGTRRGSAAATMRPPLAFVPPTDAAAGARFIARAPGFQVLLKSNGLVVARGQDAVTISFAGSAANPRIVPLDRLAGATNYVTGADSSKWRLAVPGYARVRYENLYRNIDLLVYATDRDIEFDLLVRPGGRVSDIHLGLAGGRHRVSGGELVVTAPAGEVRLRRPVAYQTGAGGKRRPVASRYAVSKSGAVGFEVGPYDRTQPLVIDPVVVYASFFGGGGDESSVTSQMVAVDAAGAAYMTGGVGGQAFVTKIAPDGTSVVYTTLLYGTVANGMNAGTDSRGHAIAVDAAGNAYVVGGTLARDFPVTAGTFSNPAHLVNQATMFLTKLRPDGSLEFSMLWGASTYDFSGDVVLDAAGNIHVAGHTCSPPEAFPITVGAAQATTSCFPSTFRHPGTDAFVVKFDPAASGVIYGTYLGGGGIEYGYGLSVDSTGAAIVTGRTTSEDFPRVAAVQSVRQGESDAFVTKISPNGSHFVYSTYLGGSSDDLGRFGTVVPNGVAVDLAGNAYVSGSTEAGDFPTTAGSYRTEKPPYSAVFVTKFSPSGDLAYSTFVTSGVATGIAVDSAGRAHVVGSTGVPNLPITPDATQPALAGSDDALLAVLSADGSALDYATYLGGPPLDFANGVAIGANGSVYIAGQTLGAGGFPTTAGAFQPAYGGGGSDFFIVRMQFTQPDTAPPSIGDVSDISVQTDSTDGAVVTFDLPVATDDADPSPLVEASPASGSLFPVGTTTVTVTATDAAGNASHETFTVTVVLSPSATIAALQNGSAAFRQGGNLLRNARENLAAGEVTAACNQLGAFSNQVRAQRGKSIAAGQADAWMASAAQIRSALGCR